MQKERVVEILTAHDVLRAHERPEFAAFLSGVFEAVEKVPMLRKDTSAAFDEAWKLIADLKSEVEALHSRVSDLNSQVAALQASLVPTEPAPTAPEAPAAQQ